MVAGAAALLAMLVWFPHSRQSLDLLVIGPVAAPPVMVTELPPAAPMTPGASSRATSADPDAGTPAEFCGVGGVRSDQSGEEYVGALMQHAERDGIAALQASSDLHARAAGLMLARPEQSVAMAQLALQNGDPALYDLALSACARAEHPSAACSQVLPEAWAQLDADNAGPWLQIAWRARLRGDRAGEHAAIERAAAAHRIDDYNYSLYAYAQRGLSADLGPMENYMLAIMAIGVEAASGGQQVVEASKYCSADAVNDPQVAEQCRSMAELLDRRGTTLLDLAIATSIGARVNWSKQRLDTAAKYTEALQAELEHVDPGPGAAQWSCDAVSAANAYLRDRSRWGELAALRERLERSGMSMSELAQQHRDYVQNLIHNAHEGADSEGGAADAAQAQAIARAR